MVENRSGVSEIDELLIVEASNSTEGFFYLPEEVLKTTVAFGTAMLNFARDPSEMNRGSLYVALLNLGQGDERVAIEFAANLLAEDKKWALEDTYVARTREGVEQS